MRLKKIELKGFKSFCDKTEILFNRNVTGIVGPNGCGKSNIVDAIRWVMGEQSAKHLRGKNMEDVIFAGSKDREPSAMSFVEITFDTQGAQTPVQYANCEEVSVGRRLFRDGTSEYLVNKQPARLKDVIDFFLGTGIGAKAYSIIEQGRVGQIVTAKPEERRRFIEEAAGISKFQIRKQAAQRKMEATHQNLMRLTDIVSEIERQKNSLERQAKKAEKFKVIRDELKDLDLKVSSLDFQKLSTRQKGHLEKLRELDSTQAALEAKIQEKQNQYEEARLTMLEIENTVSDLQQKVYEWDNVFQLTESGLQNRKESWQRLETQYEQELRHLEELEHQIIQLLAHGESAVKKSVDAELDTFALNEEVVSAETTYANLQNSAQELFEELEKAREQKSSSEQRLIEISTQKENAIQRLEEKRESCKDNQKQLEEVTQKSLKLKKLLNVSKEGLAGIKQMKFSLSEKSEKLESDFLQVEEKVKSETAELSQIKEELLQKKSRLQSLEELERNFEGYLEGPRSLLKKKQAGEMDQILGSVADFIETDSEYMGAVSAVLGEKAQTLVVPTQTEGVTCAASLRELNSGRGSFVALQWANLENTVTTREVVSAESTQVKGFVRDFVRAKSGYENLKSILFHDTLLVETLSDALDVWQKEKLPVATLGGELISREGILSGGTVEQTSSALLEKKQEIKVLQETVTTLMTQVKEKEELCWDLSRQLKTLKAELDAMKSSCHEEEIKITRQEQDIHHCQQEIESLDEQSRKLSNQVLLLENEISSLEESIKSLEEEKGKQLELNNQASHLLMTTRSREEDLQLELQNQQQNLTEQKVMLAEKRKEKTSLDAEVERIYAEHARMRQLIIRSEERVIHLQKQKIFLEQRVAFFEKNLTRIIEKKKTLEAEYRTQKDVFEKHNQSLQTIERDHSEKQREFSKHKDEANKETLALTELRGHLSRLNEQMMERYQISLSEICEEVIASITEEFDYSEAVGRAQELREQFAKAGNVNLAAIDELQEIAERYEFLATQKQDLEESLASLERAIDKINQTTKTRFEETFTLVNEKFKQVFPKLFRGGEAHLKLTDPDNILETGVDIIAQPPGKRLQSISLLSGGEKALTAVSMLFSIFLIKPSPFCLLDEVDAPLDDVNVDRYNEIVKDMSQNTQFIVVTHNKRTMQITDALYGVTMEQSGVSQLVSVDLS